MLDSYRDILLREIDKLRVEIEAFANDADIWKQLPGTTNTPGVLALHLCGNLQHFIGATLAGSGYVRDRDAEFSARDVPRATVLAEIATTRESVEAAFATIDGAKLTERFPIDKFMDGRSTEFALLHFLGHFSYHLGQINYARRGVIPPASASR